MMSNMIDEFVVFSDHHAHPFLYNSKEVLYHGVLTNSRLVDSLLVLDQIITYVELYNIDKVFFGGDLFHTREAVSTDAFNFTFDRIVNLSKVSQVVMIPGNHDYFDRAGYIHSLDTFRHLSGVACVDWRCESFMQMDFGSFILCPVPYTENKKQAVSMIKTHADYVLRQRRVGVPKILLAHLGMQGAKVGSDYVLVNSNDISVDDVPYNAFAGCLFGHYHQHQQVFNNGWYIGATHHHTWGDVNTNRGFLHVRIYSDDSAYSGFRIDFEFIECDAPRFIAVNEKDLHSTVIREKDFVKVFTERKMTTKEVTKVRENTKAENCEVIYVPPEIKLKAVELDEQHLTPASMMETWVKANEEWLTEHLPDIEQTDLVKYGKTILAKVQENG